MALDSRELRDKPREVQQISIFLELMVSLHLLATFFAEIDDNFQEFEVEGATYS